MSGLPAHKVFRRSDTIDLTYKYDLLGSLCWSPVDMSDRGNATEAFGSKEMPFTGTVDFTAWSKLWQERSVSCISFVVRKTKLVDVEAARGIQLHEVITPARFGTWLVEVNP